MKPTAKRKKTSIKVKNQLPKKSELFYNFEFNSDKTKDLILKESLRIISEKGIQALNMREVARNLNISHGTPYRHFESKEDVIIQLCIFGFRHFVRALEKDLPIPSSKDILKERLKKLKDNYIQFAVQNQELYNIIFNTKMPDKKDSLELKLVAYEAFSILLNQIALMKAAGLIKVEDVFSTSMLIFTQLHGHILLKNIGVMDGLIQGFEYKGNINEEINYHINNSLRMED